MNKINHIIIRHIVLILIIFYSCENPNNNDSCNCNKELEFVIKYYEGNLPAFKVDVTENNFKSYSSLKTNFLEKSKSIIDTISCFKLVNSYVEFFKDNHSKLTMNFKTVDESNKEELNEFLKSKRFKGRETMPIKTEYKKQYPLNDIRGIYTHKSNTYKIAIVPDKSEFRDYVGIILESSTPLWKPGQIKLEIMIDDSGNSAYLYTKNHGIRFYNRFPYNNGILGEGWFKDNLTEKIDHSTNAEKQFLSKKLNDSIAYLRFPTFSNNYNAKIDSLYKASENDIKASQYLIVDLRNNGGGNDENALPFLKYMYTNPIKTDVIDLYVTKANILKWETWHKEALRDSINYSKEDIEWVSNVISEMKSTPLNSFIKRNNGKLIELPKSEINLKKVAIIYNRNTASSAETPLFWAMQSNNCILVGENSGGYTGYGEVEYTLTGCFGFDLFSSMTKYKEQIKYDGIGVKPDFKLNNDSDWINQTIAILENFDKWKESN